MDTTPPGDADPGDGFGMMIFMDPPSHHDFRRLVNRAFTPRRVSALEDRARELCAQFLDPQLNGNGFDFVEDFAAKIPAMLIGALLGVPKQDQDQLRVWGDLLMRYEPNGLSNEKATAIANLNSYMAALVEDRQHHPRDDLISDLLSSEVTRDDGSRRQLSSAEVLGFFTLLQLAGSETTARLLGWAAVLLARHPGERSKILAMPELVPNAVEELLRYEAPSPIQARFVTREVKWHDRTVPPFSKLVLLTGSAGRDEREYPDADRFDVGRRFDRHVTFGYGIHFCLGASLARLEGRVVLEEMLARFPEWGVDETAVQLVRTSTVRGPVHVPVNV